MPVILPLSTDVTTGDGANGGRRPTVVPAPDVTSPELSERPSRRNFTVKDKLRILAQTDEAANTGGIDRATLAFWVGYGAAEIAPVVRRLKEIVLSSTRIFADETTIKILDPGRGKTKQGYFWVAARDDRAYGGADPPAVIYQYATGRAKCHADALLGGYRGIVQCDGYNAYKQLAGPAREDAPVTLAFCWSHVRRGFYDPAKSGTSPIATEALVRIATLYRIETEIRGKGPAERLAKRQELSRPLVTDLRAALRSSHAALALAHNQHEWWNLRKTPLPQPKRRGLRALAGQDRVARESDNHPLVNPPISA